MARFLQPRTRFHNHKAAYIVRARDRFFPPAGPILGKSLDGFVDPKGARAWLVREVDGLGWKEASHFLRNIGRGDGLAILDRHILRNLMRHGVIGRMPTSLTPNRYTRIVEISPGEGPGIRIESSSPKSSFSARGWPAAFRTTNDSSRGSRPSATSPRRRWTMCSRHGKASVSTGGRSTCMRRRKPS